MNFGWWPVGELVKGVVHRVGVLVKGERGVGGEIDGPMGRVGWGQVRGSGYWHPD